jgi:two-component system NtrC family sensor kinase
MLAIVLVMAVVSLSFTAEWLGKRRHDQQEIERLSTHARSLAMLAARSFGGGDFQRDELDGLLRDSSAALGVSYEVHRIRSDGESEQLLGVGIHAGFHALPSPIAGLASRVDDDLLDSYNLLIIEEPITTRDGQHVGLRMIAEHSPWASTHDWREMLIVAVGVGLLLLVLGTALLELQVLRPMRALEAAVARVGKGELEVAAPTDGPTELAELARTFNDMLASLREQRETLANQSERLQRAERLATIGRLAAGVAHEVGNPLAAIVGYTELLLDEPGLDPQSRDLLVRVAAQTQRIQTIVAQLLDYSRPAKQKIERFAAVEPAREVAALLRADPRCEGVEIGVTGEETVEAAADPSLVEQILINLVLNGARAAREGGATEPQVEIRVSALDDAVIIDVRDNGMGVPEHVRARLFEPFFTTRDAGEGTGLGLAISQGLAEGMDGALTLLSAGDAGSGAAFRLRLRKP